MSGACSPGENQEKAAQATKGENAGQAEKKEVQNSEVKMIDGEAP